MKRPSPQWVLWLHLLLLGVAPVAWAEVDMGELTALRAADRHGAAADLGLQAVLAQPWDHSLRYLVADSLERAGRFDEAATQFSALQGTPLQGAAQGRLTALAGRGTARPVAASPAPVPTPATAAAPMARPVAAPAPTPVTAADVATPNQTARAAAAPVQAAAQPKRLGAPAALAPTQTASQPRRLGAPAALAPAPAATQPRRLGAPAALAPAPAPAATQPRRLGAPAAAAAPIAPQTPAPARAPLGKAQQIDALFAKGDYAKAGELGLALLETERPDPELHLKIANSLAWSGQTRAAQMQYRALFDTAVDRQARVGLANTQRWGGRTDLAARGFQGVLDRYPDDADALEGLRLSRFDLAPRTTFSMEQTTDITPVERRGATLGHRWHSAEGDVRYEVRAVRFEDSVEFLLPAGTGQPTPITMMTAVDRQSVSASIDLLAHPLQPSLMVAVQQQPDDNVVFGTGRIKLHEWPVWLRAGRLDWGHEALAPRAGDIGLVARHAGLEAQGEFGWGQLFGQLDHFSITDGNSVSAAQLRWTPSWRPLGARWRPNLGLDFRQADQPTPLYWSPAIGHGSANVGLSGDWSKGNWDLYGSAQYGVPLLEESGNSWSLSLGGRYRIAPDLAVSFNFWRMSSERDNAAYRARTANVQVEKVWR